MVFLNSWRILKTNNPALKLIFLCIPDSPAVLLPRLSFPKLPDAIIVKIYNFINVHCTINKKLSKINNMDNGHLT